MAINHRKRLFAAALSAGATKKDAAISAGYSANGAASAGYRLSKDPAVIAEIARKSHVAHAKAKAKEQGKRIDVESLSKMYSDPKDFLQALMNDGDEDMRIRMDAAKTLMPYIHERKGEGGKKEAKQKAAEKVASKFAQAKPPKLVVNNR